MNANPEKARAVQGKRRPVQGRVAPVLSAADLPLVLALARTGTLAGAAEALEVDTSTVFRRLNELEKRLGVRLFERSPAGYGLTESGVLAATAAERVETELHALDREITGRDRQLSGSVRLTASETLSYGVLPKLISQLRTAHPGIQVTLTIDNRVLDLSRREAEVALRTRRPTEGDLFGRKLASIAWAFYGTSAHRPLKKRGDAHDVSGRGVIGWDEPSDRIVASAWLHKHVGAAQIVYRTNSLVHQLMAARANVGIALLPCYLADPIPDLVRLSVPVAELEGELWIVTHKALKDTARIRACLTIIGDGIASMQPLFEGTRTRRPQQQDSAP
jgi:DNA-binding transcriptional LysR family regulator